MDDNALILVKHCVNENNSKDVTPKAVTLKDQYTFLKPDVPLALTKCGRFCICRHTLVQGTEQTVRMAGACHSVVLTVVLLNSCLEEAHVHDNSCWSLPQCLHCKSEA